MKSIFERILAATLLATMAMTAAVHVQTVKHTSTVTIASYRVADGDIGDGTSPVKKGG